MPDNNRHFCDIDYSLPRDELDRLYPAILPVIRCEVQYELNRMDYDGSPIYDVYPDKETILAIVDAIYKRIEALVTTDIPFYNDGVSPAPGTYEKGCDNERFVRILIQVIFLDELKKHRTAQKNNVIQKEPEQD